MHTLTCCLMEHTVVLICSVLCFLCSLGVCPFNHYVKLIILQNRVAVSNSMEFSWNAVVTFKKKKEKRSLSRK